MSRGFIIDDPRPRDHMRFCSPLKAQFVFLWAHIFCKSGILSESQSRRVSARKPLPQQMELLEAGPRATTVCT